ncbi:histidine--tRNA ligase [Bartonella schoenbuchensis]|uniref:Histidine--tRNA ligase n=1 Tax=Bartonella schoenbuchensis m07a TaxID=1094496 RepID=N6VBE4_9HYPH|nr:histidine--tRNA ligase [Bartonella schoenbuchensis]ENN90571.1 histidyl-tRNA synthetase [Bartonella schoenbuchensis m07a]
MSTKQKKTKARLPRGLTDHTGAQLQALEAMTAQIREVYELYGFEALETPIFEYTDALGKSLPDVDRPNAGVFSLQDDDEQWMSLRYDLTAPLARYVAENFEVLPKPYRSYRIGPVFRNEKPGPGRFRQFMQLDADIVGASTVAADAEVCMMAADSLEKLGIKHHSYVIRVSNRKILDAVLENIGLGGDEQSDKRLIVFRAIDKLDRLGLEGVHLLLGKGRLDESGDFTKGAGLTDDQIDYILNFLSVNAETAENAMSFLKMIVGRNARGLEGIRELEEMQEIFIKNNYQQCIKINSSIVRGLDYYTGPVFEAELRFDIINNDGRKIVFGSVGGGGRYDGLIARFRDENIPATGFSIGLSRLRFALLALGILPMRQKTGPVVVLMMDQEPGSVARYQNMVKQLRNAGIRSEVYLGESGIKAQMKYADRRRAPCVVIQGSQECERGEVQIKDLVEGARLANEIKDNQTWRESRPAQITVKEDQMVEEVKAILEAQKTVDVFPF